MKGTITNRDVFLERIAGQLKRDRIMDISLPKWSFSPQDSIMENASQDELVHVLSEQCKSIHTNFITTDLDHLQETLKKIVGEYGKGPVVAWKDERFHEYGLNHLLTEEWPGEGVDVHIWDYTLGEENIKKAQTANVGLVVSEVTMAESGTVVLFSSKDKGRTMNFLPTSLVVLVPKSTIVPRMTQAARFIRGIVKKGERIPSCINFVSGPSNSGDIEMILVVGVHGPVQVAYIVIEDR